MNIIVTDNSGSKQSLFKCRFVTLKGVDVKLRKYQGAYKSPEYRKISERLRL